MPLCPSQKTLSLSWGGIVKFAGNCWSGRSKAFFVHGKSLGSANFIWLQFVDTRNLLLTLDPPNSILHASIAFLYVFFCGDTGFDLQYEVQFKWFCFCVCWLRYHDWTQDWTVRFTGTVSKLVCKIPTPQIWSFWEVIFEPGAMVLTFTRYICTSTWVLLSKPSQ